MNVNLTTMARTFGKLWGSGTINNAGTINIATTTPGHYPDFQSPTNNSGLIDVMGSRIILRGGTDPGQIQVASGRSVQFWSNDFTQSGNGSITGTGQVSEFGGGSENITFGAGTTYDVGSTYILSVGMAFNNTATTGTLTLLKYRTAFRQRHAHGDRLLTPCHKTPCNS